jgi:hypothetical protein
LVVKIFGGEVRILILSCVDTHPCLVAHVVHTNNPHYQRMNALRSMAGDTYRAEVLGGDIGDYIVAGNA